jgi:hypothetical protein
MKDRRRFDLGAHPAVSVVVLVVAALVVAAAAVQAVRQDSWGPVLTIGWLPAVLVASYYRPARRCLPPSRSRTGGPQ